MDHNEKWTTYWNSARRAVQQEKLEHAEPLLYAALDLAEDFDLGDPRLVMTLECLAEVLFRLGRAAQSEPVVKRVILLYERKYGTEHPDLGVFINNLGLVYHKQKKYFMAETEYQRALSMQTKLLGNSRANTINVMANYAKLLRETHREKEAKHLETCIKGVQQGDWSQSGSYEAYQRDPQTHLSAVGPQAGTVATSLPIPMGVAGRTKLSPYHRAPKEDITLQDVQLNQAPGSQHEAPQPSQSARKAGNGPMVNRILQHMRQGDG